MKEPHLLLAEAQEAILYLQERLKEEQKKNKNLLEFVKKLNNYKHNHFDELKCGLPCWKCKAEELLKELGEIE